MKPKGALSSPMNNPHPMPDRDGDKRDMRDHNDQQLSEPHARSKSDPANVFQEGMNGTQYVGPVDDVAADCVASPMMGQRRSATGQYESPKRIDRP